MVDAADIAAVTVVLALTGEARKRSADLAVRDGSGQFGRVEQALALAEGLLWAAVPAGVGALIGAPAIESFAMIGLETSGGNS
jgi:hypothetical protein